MIDVTKREFYHSFTKHFNCYKEMNGYARTKRLILFYAVECGLKYRLLQETGENSYKKLLTHDGMDRLEKCGHDIGLLLQKNKVERFRIEVIRMPDRRQTAVPEEFHQLWRYGIQDTVYEDETTAEKVLYEIALWLEEEL